ncbi:hypothetical protein CDAR_454221 [Caerostris darwini]|uniref:Uncharacterized protein n=1 Tax=Caerostris darwini TaxID=1538125 RepID=A0AAV4V7C5_9ARAC|nr:hypothetical protein CDAR_454221 [Caerostris darwini]
MKAINEFTKITKLICKATSYEHVPNEEIPSQRGLLTPWFISKISQGIRRSDCVPRGGGGGEKNPGIFLPPPRLIRAPVRRGAQINHLLKYAECPWRVITLRMWEECFLTDYERNTDTDACLVLDHLRLLKKKKSFFFVAVACSGIISTYGRINN